MSELHIQEKARNFQMLLYPDSMPDDAITSLLHSDCKVAISPLHQPEQDEKKTHYHCVLLFDGPKRYDTVNNFYMNKYHCPMLDVVIDAPQAIRYLIHFGYKSKIQYPFESIRANFDIRKYFAEDIFVIDIMRICEDNQEVNSYTKLIDWLIKHNKFDYLEKVAKMSYFFNKYFEIR